MVYIYALQNGLYDRHIGLGLPCNMLYPSMVLQIQVKSGQEGKDVDREQGPSLGQDYAQKDWASSASA